MKETALYSKADDVFVTILITVNLNKPSTKLSSEMKPLSIDPLYWNISGISENENQPLSFRAWGAFCCPSLPVGTIELEDNNDAQTFSGEIVHWADGQLTKILKMSKSQPFSELVKQHPNQKERGAYAITLVTALIDEKQFHTAHELASKYSSGSLSAAHSHSHLGRDYHDIAKQWIENTMKVPNQAMESDCS